MKPHIAIIGSCTTDVIIEIPHLPEKEEDIHIRTQTFALGGCAGNAACMLDLFHVDYHLCTPIGTGIYADFVRKQLKKRHQTPFFPDSEEENGCCYCFVEDDEERSFLALHGAEYHFQKQWFDQLAQEEIDTVYICGLEIEEESGIYIIDYLKAHPDIKIYFACGPRIMHIEQEKLDTLFSLSCILHLNKQEALALSGKDNIEDAAKALYAKTHQSVIITLGKDGSYLYENAHGIYLPVQAKTPVDTIGVGDGHIGSIIALTSLGYDLPSAIQIANHISGAIISKKGACLTSDEFDACMKELSLFQFCSINI